MTIPSLRFPNPSEPGDDEDDPDNDDDDETEDDLGIANLEFYVWCAQHRGRIRTRAKHTRHSSTVEEPPQERGSVPTFDTSHGELVVARSYEVFRQHA